MKRLSVLLAAGLALAACDNSTPPTKAPGNTLTQNPQSPMPQAATGGDQPGTQPKQ